MILNETKRIHRDPAIRAAVTELVKSQKARETFLVVWEHGPLTARDVDVRGKDGTLHTYLAKLERVGWVKKVGKGVSQENGKHAVLWDISGEVGEKFSHYKIRSERMNNYVSADSKSIHIRISVNIWKDISAAVKRYGAPKLSGTNMATITAFQKGVDLDTVMYREMINVRLASAIRDDSNALSDRQVLIDACETLRLDPPRVGRPIDLKIARKKMKNLARAYHPDVNAHGAEHFQRVIAAFRIVEAFVNNHNGESEE